jgi:hypothetical protein
MLLAFKPFFIQTFYQPSPCFHRRFLLAGAPQNRNKQSPFLVASYQSFN